jgi:hypothetical protein
MVANTTEVTEGRSPKSPAGLENGGAGGAAPATNAATASPRRWFFSFDGWRHATADEEFVLA